LGRTHKVGNLSSPHTLIGGFQAREAGIVIDSVSRHHAKDRHGNKGEQAIFFPQAQKSIPVVVCSALMTFEILEPTDDDMMTLRIMDLTPPKLPEWKPDRYSDDPGSVLPGLHDIVGPKVYHSSAADSAVAVPKQETVTDDLPPSEETVPADLPSGLILPVDPAANLICDAKGEIGDALGDQDTRDRTILDDKQFYSPQEGSDVQHQTDPEIDIDGSPLYYFDPSDINERNRLGKAFHLTMDYQAAANLDEPVFVRANKVEFFIACMDSDELYGRDAAVDTFAYAIRTIQ
jgi:hypothetical protein